MLHGALEISTRRQRACALLFLKTLAVTLLFVASNTAPAPLLAAVLPTNQESCTSAEALLHLETGVQLRATELWEL